MEIAKTSNYKLLLIDGVATDDVCLLKWEEIIKKNARMNNDNQYDNYLDNIKVYGTLIAEYNMVKAMLLQLIFQVDNDVIQELELMGYHIDTSGERAYTDSIYNCMNSSENIITQIKMKYNEIMLDLKGSEQDGSGFEETLANLSVSLGFTVMDDITLARFNEYKRIIRKKNSRLKSVDNG